MTRIPWKSPPIPDDLLEEEDFSLPVMEKAQELMSSDDACVWFTDIAMAETSDGGRTF